MRAKKLPVSNTLQADILLIVATLLAAVGWVLSKEALAGLPPLLFIGLRFTAAGCILAMFCKPYYAGITASAWANMLLVGAVMGLAIMSWILGLHYTKHIGEGAFLTSLGVVFAPLLGHFLFGEYMTKGAWVSLFIAFIGLACLSLNNVLVNQGFKVELGQIFFVISAVLLGLQFNLTSRLSSKQSTIVLTSVQLLVTGLMSLLASLIFEVVPNFVATEIWFWLLASILIATCLRFYIQFMGQGKTTVSHAALLMTLEPVWVFILAVTWFANSLTLLQLLGCALIFISLLFSRLYKAK